jgi:hypothetical protein
MTGFKCYSVQAPGEQVIIPPDGFSHVNSYALRVTASADDGVKVTTFIKKIGHEEHCEYDLKDYLASFKVRTLKKGYGTDLLFKSFDGAAHAVNYFCGAERQLHTEGLTFNYSEMNFHEGGETESD